MFLEKRQAREGALTKIAAERDGEGRVGGQSRIGIAAAYSVAAFVAAARRWWSRQNDLAVGGRHLPDVLTLYISKQNNTVKISSSFSFWQITIREPTVGQTTRVKGNQEKVTSNRCR